MKSARRLELELAVFGSNHRLAVRDAIIRAKRELNRELTEQEIEGIETIRAHVFETATKLAPHFGMIWYRGTLINLTYYDYEENEYKTAVKFDGYAIYVFHLDEYSPREMVSRALEVLGNSARVGWKNGKPTISKGYFLKPFDDGWEIIKD